MPKPAAAGATIHGAVPRAEIASLAGSVISGTLYGLADGAIGGAEFGLHYNPLTPVHSSDHPVGIVRPPDTRPLADALAPADNRGSCAA